MAPFGGIDHLYFTVLDFENIPQIVDMIEDEIEISELARLPEEIDTVAAPAGLGWRVAPSADQVRGLLVLGRVAFPHQACGNPCAADLIFFPKLTLAPGSDDRDARMTCGQMRSESGVTPEATQVDRIATRSLMNDLGAGSGH
jgi:hypothetical protein